MRVLFLLFISLFISKISLCQESFSVKEILGHEIGADFSRHSQVTEFFKKLQQEYPNNSRIESYGVSNEGRELLTMFLGSESIINNLNQIKADHKNHADAEKIPIVWLSYNVHGNESSGSEAAMETALSLLQDKIEWLDNVLVIIDPCLNPDGRDRYVNFFKQYASKSNNPNSLSLEHQEPWPGGRLNHYLFDLNRDWAWLTQIESVYRIKLYNQWLPHLHVDFHEQGINENYYFPPAAEPYHEIITDWQREFQELIGKNHADYFDSNDWLYFSDEIFDLLYPSYGDTYPMFNGAIGMTYEQAGSGRAGSGVILNNGDTLTLRDRIDHHVTTGLSTIEVAITHRKRLIEEFKDFSQSQAYKYESYILSGEEYKIQALIEFLDLHEIETASAQENLNIKAWSYHSQQKVSYKTIKSDVVVSTNQLKGPLVKVLFEPQTFITDSLTYDITAWSLPYAYGIDAFASENLIPTTEFQAGEPKEINGVKENTYAYVCKWSSMESARFLERILLNNVAIRFAKKSFEIDGKFYGMGSLIILVGDNEDLNIYEIIKNAARNLIVDIAVYNSGHVEKGNDFGSSSFELISKSNIGLLVGDYFSPTNVGEIWHFFENDLEINFDMLHIGNIAEVIDIVDYDILMLPEGELSEEFRELLEKWVSQGGKLIIFGEAIAHFSDVLGISGRNLDMDENGDSFDSDERDEVSHMITGAIYECKIDYSNPLAFGYKNYYTLRQNQEVYKLKGKGSVFELNENAQQIAGFVGSMVSNEQSNALIAGVGSLDKGQIIYLIDNPLFRCFWQSGKLMVANALYFVND